MTIAIPVVNSQNVIQSQEVHYYKLSDIGGISMLKGNKKDDRVENGLRTEYFIKGDRLKSITELMNETNTPGMSVAVINDYEIIWAKGYGFADTEKGILVDTNTIFQAASISKPLTALAVMKLVQEGILDLDKDINTYLKSWKLPESEFTAKNKVTLRNLLSHTAGVTIHGFPGYKPGDEVPTLIQVLNGEAPAVTGKVRVDMEPDTQFRYSGGGMAIVQQVLVDQLQKSFQEIMRELVLEPLSMTNSFYSNCDLSNEQSYNAAAGHNSEGEQIPERRYVYPEMAAAGLWSTAEDLAKFSIEVQKSLRGDGNKILSKEFMEIMTTPVLHGECNIGLFNEIICRESLVGHDGGNTGYACSMQFHKEKGFGVIMMTNSDSGYKMKMPVIRSAAATYGWYNLLHPEYQIVYLSLDEIKFFCGNYKMEIDKTLKIFHQDNSLFYKTIYDEPKQLDYVGNNIFIDRNREVKFDFIKDSDKLYMNGNEIERLNDEENLASDYIVEGNLDQAVRCYQELMARDCKMKNLLENSLNDTGYDFLWKKDYSTASAFLKVGTILFPQSANAWDSLGEAYFEGEQYELCIEAMEKSLECAPDNQQNAVNFIKDSKQHLKEKV
ncbi:CubicO group peptidase, beta-lactamase class C family [Clostridium acidisoli DSM 12555]|uniref:CubicO group peptidase, beta-lactamase class C family n=2 Tax=Clostridium TaxID=1485 RepID=A0A1W1X483_9CLOT|nr:CubicO group peptidase, beta-lactamase class C family [Clostridium acidisoli DSM 12555]